jgi:uncharacterized protein YjbI with pentapeptide repeats
MDDSGRPGFGSRLVARRLFSLVSTLILIASAISLAFAVTWSLLDLKLVSVGDATIMTMCLSVVLYSVTWALFGRVASRPMPRFSDPASRSNDLWDAQLDAVIYDPPFQGAGLTEVSRRPGGPGSMRRSGDFIRIDIDPTNLSDRPASSNPVERLRELNRHGHGLTFAELSAIDLRGADLRGADLSRIDLSWGRFRQADFRESNLHGTLFVGADLSLADFRDANLSGGNFRQANLREAVLRWVDLRRADLTGADLCGANLEGAALDGADLRGASLRRASMHSTNFGGADLSEADLREADLRGANLSGARGLVRKQFDSTKGDDTTLLPQGLVRPRRWAKTVSDQGTART